MEHIAPTSKDKLVSFPLTEMNDAMDASKTASSVLTSVSDGELTPIEGSRVMGLIDSYRRTLELTDIENRLKAWNMTLQQIDKRLSLIAAKAPDAPNSAS